MFRIRNSLFIIFHWIFYAWRTGDAIQIGGLAATLLPWLYIVCTFSGCRVLRLHGSQVLGISGCSGFLFRLLHSWGVETRVDQGPQVSGFLGSEFCKDRIEHAARRLQVGPPCVYSWVGNFCCQRHFVKVAKVAELRVSRNLKASPA